MPENLDTILTGQSLIRQRWLPQEAAIRSIIGFERRFGAQHLRLACHAAFPLLITPRLLNLIHINFLSRENIPWIAESDFLLSPLCRPVDETSGLFEVEPGIQQVLLAELEHQFGPRRPFELANFLLAYIADRPDWKQQTNVRRTHQWIARAYLDPDTVIQEMNNLLEQSISSTKDQSVFDLPNQFQVATIVEVAAEPLKRTNLPSEYQYLLNNSRVLTHFLYGNTQELQQKISQNIFERENIPISPIILKQIKETFFQASQRKQEDNKERHVLVEHEQKNIVQKIASHSIFQDLAPCIYTGQSLLFWGESGSGMGFYARAIHEASRAGKLLRKPCFELDEAAFQEQLFGAPDHAGWLEEYDQGTIFFKRITETSSAVQHILRNIISHQSVDGRIEFSRKGATEVRYVNVRFIFSMVKGYDLALQEGSLLRELAEIIRRRGKIIHLPPLRERKEDIITIALNLIAEMNAKYGQQVTEIDENAETALLEYDWPENVDEMKWLFEGIFSQYPGIQKITSEHLPQEILDVRAIPFDYTFTLKNNEHFSGTLLADTLAVRSTAKDQAIFHIKTDDLIEVIRVDDPEFVTPKLRYFVFKLKNGDQIIGNFAEKTIAVKTAYASRRQIDVLDLYESKSLKKPYTVCLSFNSEDRDAVEYIARYLADQANLRPWFDQWDMIPGEPWVRNLERGLAASATCAVFVGKSGEGPWQKKEVETALRHQLDQQEFRVIPVLLPDAPHEPILPIFLSANMCVDFRGKRLDDDDALWRLECGIRGIAPGSGRRSSPPPPITTLSPGKARRLRQQIVELQSQWDLLHEKLMRLEKQYRLEARTDEQFRLEHQLKELKTQQEELGIEMEQIEAQLHATEANTVLSSQAMGSSPGMSQEGEPEEGKFEYDVFLSHSGKDKPLVRELANRLSEHGLRVWLDEWIIKPGNDITSLVDHGKSVSRTLILCMSSAMFNSDWGSSELNSTLFRDPTNRERRFIPLLLEDCKIPDALRRFKYIDYRNKNETGFQQLVDICHPDSSETFDSELIIEDVNNENADELEIPINLDSLREFMEQKVDLQQWEAFGVQAGMEPFPQIISRHQAIGLQILLFTLQTVNMTTIAQFERLFEQFDQKQEQLEHFVEQIKAKGGSVHAVPVDVLILLTSIVKAEQIPADFDWGGKYEDFYIDALHEILENKNVQEHENNGQVMDSTLFIIQEEVPGLIKAVMNFAGAFQNADDRRAVLSAAGIDASFMSGMKFDTAPVLFANSLVARLREYKASTQRLDYHPLIALCSFWLDAGANHYGLDDQDAALCQKILAGGRENLNVIEKIDDTQQAEEDAPVRYEGKPPTLAELRKHLADFLQTAIDLSDSTSQRTFIDQVGFEARLRQQIHFGGVQSQFISLLISTLMNYGTLDDGRDALEAMLETAKGYVSKNYIRRCDELIQELRMFHAQNQKTV